MVTAVLRRAGLALVVAALVVLAGLSLNRVYSGWLLVQLVAGAAVAASLLSALGRRLWGWVVATVSLGAMAGYALWAVDLSARAGGVPGDVPALTLDAARNALPRLLTALIPIEPQPDTVLGPVVFAWLAAFAGTELAVRASRPAAALIPPTLIYAGSLVLVGPNAPVALWQPLLFAGLAALGIAVGSAVSGAAAVRGIGTAQRALLRARTASGLVVGLAAVLAAVVALSPLVANTVGVAPGDLRRYVEPPELDVLDQNPLIRIPGWAAFPEQELFQVEILSGGSEPAPTPPNPTPSESLDPFAPDVEAPAPPPVDQGTYDMRVRLAVLPDWDGVTWHIDADYRDAGRVLPPVAPPPGVEPGRATRYPPRTVQQRITVAELRGRLLPTVASPTRVEGIRVAYDQTIGALLNHTPLTRGTQYTVTSVNESIDATLLMASVVPHGDAVARYLQVGPTVPEDLTQFVLKVTEGSSSPYLKALAIQSFMQEHYRFAADAPSGHAYPNLSFFLLSDTRAGGQRGTSEQFAAGFAALGRLVGLPTRVVVGFHVPAGGGMVTAGDAVAWPEVLFENIGWVPFDPLPLAGTPPRPVEPEYLPPPPATTTPPVEVTPSVVLATTDATTRRAVAAPAPGGPGAATIAALSGAGLFAIALLAAFLIMLLRAVRSRRRLAAADPAQQVVGAWDEVLDGLLLAGRPPPPHLAAAEVADHAAAVIAQVPGRHVRRRRVRPAGPDLSALAATVNAVAFGGDTVPAPSPETAATAREGAVAFRRTLYQGRSWWRRMLGWVDPRPLRRRAR